MIKRQTIPEIILEIMKKDESRRTANETDDLREFIEYSSGEQWDEYLKRAQEIRSVGKNEEESGRHGTERDD